MTSFSAPQGLFISSSTSKKKFGESCQILLCIVIIAKKIACSRFEGGSKHFTRIFMNFSKNFKVLARYCAVSQFTVSLRNLKPHNPGHCCTHLGLNAQTEIQILKLSNINCQILLCIVMMAKKIIHACSIKKAIKVTEDAVFFFVLKLPYTYVHFFFVKWEM